MHPWLTIPPKMKAAIGTLVVVEGAIVAQWLRGEITGRDALAAGILAAAPVVAGYLKA